MNRRVWHLISTGYRPKDGTDVICIFHDDKAIECHYDREFDDFIHYDQEWDINPFNATEFKHGVLTVMFCLIYIMLTMIL